MYSGGLIARPGLVFTGFLFDSWTRWLDCSSLLTLGFGAFESSLSCSCCFCNTGIFVDRRWRRFRRYFCLVCSLSTTYDRVDWRLYRTLAGSISVHASYGLSRLAEVVVILVPCACRSIAFVSSSVSSGFVEHYPIFGIVTVATLLGG